MRRVGLVLAAALFVILGFGSALSAQQSRADVALRAAIELEVVRGDLKAAIEQYKRIVDDHRDNRRVAAQALVRLAEAYQKLGDSQATTIYTRIVREFSDQHDAVTLARARLRPSAGASGEGVILRFIKTRRNTRAFTPSPDGRYLAFHNWDTNGHLALYDLATGVERDVTRDSPSQSDNSPSQFPVFTPDSKRIVYTTRAGSVPEVRMINVDGTSMRTILRNAEYRYLSTHGISPDATTVAALVGTKDQTWQIALVSVDTGKLRVLKSVGWDRPSIGNFSADGRWIVYAVRPREASAAGYDVYAIAVDGGGEFRIATAATGATPYFSPDASRVVFVGERLGKRVLWSVRVADARPTAAPEVLKVDVGAPMGFTAGGSLYLWDHGSRIGIFTADMDPVTWRARSSPTEISDGQRHYFALDPAWSPDGKLLAYSVPSASAADSNAYNLQMQSIQSKATTIVIRDQTSGQEREFVTAGRLRGWLDDGQSILMDAGAGGLRSIRVDTGSERVLVDKQVGLPAASLYGNAIFYYLRDSGFSSQPGRARPAVETVRVMRRDTATGEERELCRLEAARGIITDLSPSPDGSRVAFLAVLPSEEGRLFVVSASGIVRQIERPVQTLAGGFTWTGDGKALLFIGGSDEPLTGRQAWAVPVDGAAPYATGIEVAGLYSLSAHPAGRVAFTGSVREADEISVIESVFPKH
jgi:Tol biopolymer transport system component